MGATVVLHKSQSKMGTVPFFGNYCSVMAARREKKGTVPS